MTKNCIIRAPHSFLCPEDHFAQYNHLIGLEQDAIETCETSLMAAYDDYDTLAADALVAKESVKVIFRIRGDQMAPGQKSPPASGPCRSKWPGRVRRRRTSPRIGSGRGAGAS